MKNKPSILRELFVKEVHAIWYVFDVSFDILNHNKQVIRTWSFENSSPRGFPAMLREEEPSLASEMTTMDQIYRYFLSLLSSLNKEISATLSVEISDLTYGASHDLLSLVLKLQIIHKFSSSWSSINQHLDYLTLFVLLNI